MYRVGIFVADVYQRGNLAWLPSVRQTWSKFLGTNDFPVPGYDYTFSTYLDTPNGQQVEVFTSAAPEDHNVPSSVSSPSSPSTAIIVGIIGGVVLVALIAAVVVYKRRKSRTAVYQTEWMSVAEATNELKARFGDQSIFGDNTTVNSGVHRYQQRHLASFTSIVRTEETLHTEEADDLDHLQMEGAIMTDKQVAQAHQERSVIFTDMAAHEEIA
jgi:hypothetical protein